MISRMWAVCGAKTVCDLDIRHPPILKSYWSRIEVVLEPYVICILTSYVDVREISHYIIKVVCSKMNASNFIALLPENRKGICNRHVSVIESPSPLLKILTKNTATQQ